MNSKRLTYENLARAVRSIGGKFYDEGDYNLNIVGIRTDDFRSNLFNDWIVVAFRQNDHEQLFAFPATTDPGVYWREHPMNVNGTAILKRGHYPYMFQVGQHQGRYLALVQRGPCTVYRDANHDAVLDAYKGIPQETGLFGINIHRASAHGVTDNIGRWSAGCQVLANSADFDLFMALVTRAARIYGQNFSYTLISERDLWQ